MGIPLQYLTQLFVKMQKNISLNCEQSPLIDDLAHVNLPLHHGLFAQTKSHAKLSLWNMHCCKLSNANVGTIFGSYGLTHNNCMLCIHIFVLTAFNSDRVYHNAHC